MRVPKIPKSLLSISQFTKDNNVVIEFFFDSSLVKDKITKNTLSERALRQGLYQLNFSKVQSNSQKAQSLVSCFTQNRNIVKSCPNSISFLSCKIPSSNVQSNKSIESVSISSLDVWHKRLGHPSICTLKQVLACVNESSKSMKKLSLRSACKFGKTHQENFPFSLTKTSKPFELVHSDVWGRSHTVSIDGYRYYLHFIDDFTQFTWIFPLKTKSKCLKLFVQFNKFVERQFNYKIKCLQTDWGGEFLDLFHLCFLA